MNRKGKRAGGRIAAAVCTATLSAGLILPSVSHAPIVRTVRAEERSEKTQELLKAGNYVEGEALVVTADSETTTYIYKENPLLDQSEEIFTLDSETDHLESKVSSPVKAPQETKPDQIKGTIKLVKSSTMSTKELIESLYEDPDVLYAEPNYISASAENHSSSHRIKENEKSNSSNEEKRKEGSASDFADNSQPEEARHKLSDDESQANEADDLNLTESNFGPSAYTPEQIPDMTEWQWGNWNNGSLAGTYTHSGTVDVQYDEWKTQTKEQLPEYVIAVLDDGIDETNPDLAEVLWTGDVFNEVGDRHGCYPHFFSDMDFSDSIPTSTTNLLSGHGSHVAGIIAGQWNGQGISGIAPNVKLMSLRTDYSSASILACMAYAKEAARKGVNLIAVNNSWNSFICASNLCALVIDDLGKMGIVSVFCSGNASVCNDQILALSSSFANSPYVIVVNAADPNGRKAPYSDYGVQTTDVMAPGTSILSTVLNRDKELSFMGEVNAHAPEGSEARENLVSYTSFDDQSVNPFESFTVYTDKNGDPWGTELNYPVIMPDAGTFDGTGALLVRTNENGQAGIVSSVKDLSGLETKPRFVSYRYCAGQPYFTAESAEISIPVIYTHLTGPDTKAYKFVAPWKDYARSAGNYVGQEIDLSDAEVLNDDEIEQGIIGCCINWEEFSMTLYGFCSLRGSPVPGTIYFDSIALGSCCYPYEYYSGTSMAAPAAAGVLAVIAGRYADSLGPLHTADFAEKLAALVKGGAVTRPEYDQICSTSGFVSVEGAQNPGPVITAIQDGRETFTLTGYFLDQAAVSLDGTACSYTVDSSENDRSVLTVQKPEGFSGGMTVAAVQGMNGKIHRSKVKMSEPSGQKESGLYDSANIPLPKEIERWNNYDLTAYNKLIYIIPRSLEGSEKENRKSMFAFSPESCSWEEIKIPIEDLTYDGLPLLKYVMDMTACVKDGKLLLLLTGSSVSDEVLSVLVSMDADRNFNVLGVQSFSTVNPILGTMVSDGSDLYLAGGYAANNPDATGGHISSLISRLEVGSSLEIRLVPIGTMLVPRVMPRVSCANGTMIISSGTGEDGVGGIGIEPAIGAEQFVIGQTKSSLLSFWPLFNGNLLMQFSSGALADGTFIFAGPESRDGNTDTYIMNQDLTPTEFDKRVWTANLLNPASVAYNNAFYVLATIVPSGTGSGTRVFSSTAANAGIPDGDALIKKIQSVPAKTGNGMPELNNTEITVTHKDLISSLKGHAQKAVDQINQSAKDSEVYLEADRLVKNDVPEGERTAILTAAKQEQTKENLFWMDLSMYLQIPEQERIRLDDNLAGTKVSMKFPEFPEIQKGYSRSYQIYVCRPDGEGGKSADVITPELDAENRTLSFHWKNSSVYAVGYVDIKDAMLASDSDPGSASDPIQTLNAKKAGSSVLTAPSKTAVPASSGLAASAASGSPTAAQTSMVLWSTLTAAVILLSAAYGFGAKKRKQ